MSNSVRYATLSEQRLLRAYRLTRYSAPGIEILIGRRVASAIRSGVLITAWNPLSRRMPEGWNQRMQRRLAERVRRYEIQAADGSLGRWREAHIMVLADVRPMLRLARQFRQRAIVVLRQGQPASLAWLRYGGFSD